MKQSILSQNDLVRYHVRNEALDKLGFVIGQYYLVNGQLDFLNVKTDLGHVYLTDGQGLTDYADYFSKHRCPVTLPLGTLQKRLGQNG